MRGEQRFAQTLTLAVVLVAAYLIGLTALAVVLLVVPVS